MRFNLNDRVRLTRSASERIGEPIVPMMFVRYKRNGMAVTVKDGRRSKGEYLPDELELMDNPPATVAKVFDVVTIPGEGWTFRGNLFLVIGQRKDGWLVLERLFGDHRGEKIQAYKPSELLVLPELCPRQ